MTYKINKECLENLLCNAFVFKKQHYVENIPRMLPVKGCAHLRAV